jgi:hypothetical protein
MLTRKKDTFSTVLGGLLSIFVTLAVLYYAKFLLGVSTQISNERLESLSINSSIVIQTPPSIVLQAERYNTTYDLLFNVRK